MLEAIRLRAQREKLDEATAIRQLISLGLREYAIDLYREGKFTLNEAAELAGLAPRDMMEALWGHGVKGNVTLDQQRQALAHIAARGRESPERSPSPAGDGMEKPHDERLLKEFIEAVPKSQKKKRLRIDWDEMHREPSGVPEPPAGLVPGVPGLTFRAAEPAMAGKPLSGRPASRAPANIMVTSMPERIAMFVDSANMHHACKRAGFFIDWRKAREHFTRDQAFAGAFFYYAVPPNVEPERQRFLDFLSYNGYVVRTKPLRSVPDGQGGEQFQRADVGVDIAIDMLTTCDQWDTAYLFSGEGDFARLVEALRARGKRVHIVSSQGMLARELAYAADKPVFWLEELERYLGRTDRRPEKQDAEGMEERVDA